MKLIYLFQFTKTYLFVVPNVAVLNHCQEKKERKNKHHINVLLLKTLTIN